MLDRWLASVPSPLHPLPWKDYPGEAQGGRLSVLWAVWGLHGSPVPTNFVRRLHQQPGWKVPGALPGRATVTSRDWW